MVSLVCVVRKYEKVFSYENGGDNKDHRVAGGNPCLEQSLESAELCCLVETFPSNHDSFEDWCKNTKICILYSNSYIR